MLVRSIGAIALLVASGCGKSSTSPASPSGRDAGSPDGQALPDASDAATECQGMPLPPRVAHPRAAAPVKLEGYFPTTGFRTADPADAGMDASKLSAAIGLMLAHAHTQAVVVLRHGYIVGEAYTDPFTATTRHESYSMAKSITSAVVGIAIDRGLLSGVDARVCSYYSEWDCGDQSDPRSRITVEHTMNIETGLDWHEDWRVGATGTNDAIAAGADMLDYVLAKRSVAEPGTVRRYSTGDPALLSGVLQGVTGKTVLAYAKEVLLDPIGLSEVAWNADSKGRTTTYAGVQATARELAKFGLLYAHHGEWDGKQIVPGAWIDFTTRAKDPCRDEYRYLWHINAPVRLGQEDPSCEPFACPPKSLADLPADAFFAEGVVGQFVFVVPSADLVIVRLAQDDFGAEYWDDAGRGVLMGVLEAVGI